MTRKTAPAIHLRLKTPASLEDLKAFGKDHKNSDFKARRRAPAVASYIEGQSVIDIAQVLEVEHCSGGDRCATRQLPTTFIQFGYFDAFQEHWPVG